MESYARAPDQQGHTAEQEVPQQGGLQNGPREERIVTPRRPGKQTDNCSVVAV